MYSLVSDFFEAEGKNYEIIYSAIKIGKKDEKIVEDYKKSLDIFDKSKRCVSMKHYFLLVPLEYQIKLKLIFLPYKSHMHRSVKDCQNWK